MDRWIRRLLAALASLLAAFGVGCWLLVRAALPPVPVVPSPPLPEAARQLLWVDLGGADEARGWGPARLMGDLAKEFAAAFRSGRASQRSPRWSLARTAFYAMNWPPFGGPSELGVMPTELRLSRSWSADQALDRVGSQRWCGGEGLGLADGARVVFGRPIEELDHASIAFLIVRCRPRAPTGQQALDTTRRLLEEAGEEPPADLDVRLAPALAPIPDPSAAPTDDVLAYCAERAAFLVSCNGRVRPDVSDDWVGADCPTRRARCTPAALSALRSELACLGTVPCEWWDSDTDAGLACLEPARGVNPFLCPDFW